MEFTEDIYKKIRLKLIYVCAKNDITPNMVTIFNHIITLGACLFFIQGKYWMDIVGLSVLGINRFLDYLDGDLAKTTNKTSAVGDWLDSKADVIIQNIVMGAISIGCYRMGMSVFWIVGFYIANTASNMISFYYNETFGFSSIHGNELFRGYMDSKNHLINMFLKNIVDPTSSFAGLVIYTFRYWVLFGLLFGIMPIYFKVITIIANLRWIIMFILYAMYLSEVKKYHVVNALAILSEERQEHYAVRNS